MKYHVTQTSNSEWIRVNIQRILSNNFEFKPSTSEFTEEIGIITLKDLEELNLLVEWIGRMIIISTYSNTPIIEIYNDYRE